MGLSNWNDFNDAQSHDPTWWDTHPRTFPGPPLTGFDSSACCQLHVDVGHFALLPVVKGVLHTVICAATSLHTLPRTQPTQGRRIASPRPGIAQGHAAQPHASQPHHSGLSNEPGVNGTRPHNQTCGDLHSRTSMGPPLVGFGSSARCPFHVGADPGALPLVVQESSQGRFARRHLRCH